MSSSYGAGAHAKVRVIVRTKPTSNFPHDTIGIEDDGKTIKISLQKNSDQLQGFINNQQLMWNFKMDKVLHNASQEEVYHRCASDIIGRVLEGYNGTVMAFGQTGAGKTYTMTGSSTSYGQRGIIPRAISQLFREAEEKLEYSVNIRVSYLEIYNDCIRDLLSTLPDEEKYGNKPNRSSLTISDDGSGLVRVKGLAVKTARTEEDALNMLFEGEMNRCISEHTLNQYSSRSHCIFTIYVESRSRTHSLASYTVSKLNLVDLAGSERLSKTNSVGSIQCEAKYINKSLSFLEQVTLALTERNRDHIPYRQSKLTHILKDSIGGNCSTVMIANIWVAVEHIEETISTMKFATRVMRISNVPVKNVLQDPQLLIREFEEEIKALRMELAMHDTLVGKSATSYEPLSEVDVQNIDHQIKLYVNDAIPELEVRSVRQVKGVFSRFKHFVIAAESLIKSSSSSNIAGMPLEPIAAKKSSVIGKGVRKSQHHVKTLAPPSAMDNEPEATPQDVRVGEPDGMGFALGVATPDTKISPLQMGDMKRVVSPIASMRKVRNYRESTSKSMVTREEFRVQVDTSEEGRGGSSPSSAEDISQSPPPKEEEFEKFKKGRGQKIHEAFLANKEQYHSKKKECVDLAAEINILKKEIDAECRNLEEHKKKTKLHAIPLTTDTGEIILDEVEFVALTRLKQLKADYRKKYESLQLEQSCLKTLNQYVDKARSKLLAEFDEWYRICYIGGEPIDGGTVCEEVDAESPHNKKRGESEYEKFERLQSNLLKKDPSTAAFYHAQLRTEKRSFSRKQSRKPGEPVATMRNKPPGLMTFT